MRRYSLLVRILAPLAKIVGRIIFTKHRIEFSRLAQAAARRTKETAEITRYIGRYFARASHLVTSVECKIFGSPGHQDLQNESWGPFAWEAPIAITVYLAGHPVLGFAYELREDILCIRQMQGIKGNFIGKDLQQWPRIFVAACVEYAKDHNLEAVRLYRADQGLFYHDPFFKDRVRFEDLKTQRKAHRERMRRRYDGTARQMGFTMKKKWGEWINPNYTRR